MLLSSSATLARTVAVEVTSEASTAEVEATVLALGVALVVYGALAGRRHRRPWILSAAGYALVLAAMAVAARTGGWLTAADRPVTDWFVDHRNPALDRVAIAVTTVGGPPETAALGVVVAALLVWRTKRYAPALAVLATVGAAAVTCTVLKAVVARERPPLSLQLVLETDHSFPSGHVTGTATLLLTVAVVCGRSSRSRAVLTTVAVAGTVVVAATRLYLGVHWLTDVCGGMVLACLAVTIGAALLHAHESRITPAPTPTKEVVAA